MKNSNREQHNQANKHKYADHNFRTRHLIWFHNVNIVTPIDLCSYKRSQRLESLYPIEPQCKPGEIQYRPRLGRLSPGSFSLSLIFPDACLTSF